MQGNGLYSVMELMQTVLRWLAAVFLVVAGAFHFVKPELYLQIMPPYLPAPQVLVVISGMAEIAGGLGLLIRPLRHAAGWGLMALLLAVFPANIYMAQHPANFHFTPWLLWTRLPFQALLLAWVWFAAIQRLHPKEFNSPTPP
jgi:uncharacterized membrane protein